MKQSPVFYSPVLGLRMKKKTAACSVIKDGQEHSHLMYSYKHTQKHKGSELAAYPSFTVITINWRINQLQGRDGLVHIDPLEECRFRGESALYL